jgi:hypothetical protein
MAIPAQGCVVTWADFGGSSSTVQEVQEIDIRPTLERVDFRENTYFIPGGELALTGFSNAALPASKLLNWGTLRVTVQTPQGSNLVLHEGYAQYVAATTRATVNGAVLFAFQFRLWGAFSSIGTNA